LNKKKSALAAISILRQICTHPSLLHIDLESCKDSIEMKEIISKSQITSDTTVKEIIGISGKLTLLVELLRNLKEENHRVLIFSMSVKMLNVIQMILKFENHKYCRLGMIKDTL
jgi:SNF2 family DNA or RNA helicase